jgi:hypothetical protein
MTIAWPNEYLDELADGHRSWLRAFDSRHLQEWEKLYEAEVEAALAEARVRGMLSGWGIQVEPNLNLDGSCPSPDFKCLKGEYVFYVEVTCILIETATAKTGIPHEPHGVTPCSPLNDAIFNECKGKAAQCANVGGPCLLAVGTFHTYAARHSCKKLMVEWLLTGEPQIAWDMNPRTGQGVEEPYQVTKSHSAAFLRPDRTEGIRFARNSISGLLVCSYGSEPPRVIGVRHPNAVRPFDPTILPDIEFGQVEIDRDAGCFRVKWPNGPDD